MRTLKTTDRSGEQGIALVMALLMVLAVSVVTGSLVMVARSEALSSTSYTSMSQVRYGAESGVHAAANYLLFMYAQPTAASATDPFASYDMTVSPVRFNNQEVVLSSDPAVPSNYPVPAVVAAFAANSVGNLNVNGAPVAHAARARLMSMSTVTDFFTQQPVTLQTWEITGVGRIIGSGQSLVEVEATVERRPVPVFSYAAFATSPGCNALSFAGGATTNSYDSGAARRRRGCVIQSAYWRECWHQRQPRWQRRSDDDQRHALHAAIGCRQLHREQRDRGDDLGLGYR